MVWQYDSLLSSLYWGHLMRYVYPTVCGSEIGDYPNDEGEPLDLGGCPMFRKKHLSHGNYPNYDFCSAHMNPKAPGH